MAVVPMSPAQGATTPAPKRRWTSSRLSEGQFSLLLVLPLIAVLLAVVAYPIGYSIYMSLHFYEVIFNRVEYVGFQNYSEIIRDPAVWHSFRVTVYYTIVAATFSLVIAVGGALLLNEKFRGKPILMTAVILPWAVSLYATSIVWKYLYSPEWGFFNALLLRLNIIDRPFDFLSADWAVLSVAVAHSWQIAPLGIYFILATLQMIPEDQYKMAKLDRLGPWGRFRHVVLPYIKAPLLIVMVLITVEAARVFDTIFFLTNGGPGNVSTTLTWMAYRETFQKRAYGDGAAIGWLLVIFTTIITTAYFLLLFYRRKTKVDAEGVAIATPDRRIGPFSLGSLIALALLAVPVIMGLLYFPEMLRVIIGLFVILTLVGALVVGSIKISPRARSIVIYFLAAVLLVWTLVPFYWLLNMSLMLKNELLSVPTHFWPHEPTLSNYIRLFGGTATGPRGEELLPLGQAASIRRGLLNSALIASAVTLLTMLVALPVSYALGRLNFRGKMGLLFAIIATRSYPPIAIVIPFFYLYADWGLLGTRRGLGLIYFTLTVPMVVWVLTSFFAQLPRTVEAAARVDGNTRFQTFYRVILPMSWPGIAVATAISFMVCWNEFAFASFLTAGSPAQTFPPILPTMFFQISMPTEMAATSIVGIIPPAILAYLFQRRIRSLNLVDPL
jgi:ABC-type sugar transport system permease subunit